MESKDSKEVLKRALVELKKLRAERAQRRSPVALIGAACRMPNGDDPEAFFASLLAGVDAISELPAGRWDVSELYDPDPEHRRLYTLAGGFLRDVQGFDARFFGISPREAEHVDPQQRLLLEVAYEALDDAGLPAESIAGQRVGVYVGLSSSDYFQRYFEGAPARDPGYVLTGVVPCLASGRLAHALGVHGPNLTVDTACSSSLVATHLAVRALRGGECDVAIVGGVNALLAAGPSLGFCSLRALSPDGRCKTFDARADGYVRGEGCGVVVLRRLEDAERAHDRVQAVIRGTANNHDGRSSGLTVPSGPAQQAVIRAALEDAGLRPADIDLLEAHGTGTPLGDPVEVRAASAVYGEGRERPLLLGAVKTNIGHLEAAAGVAGLLKAAIAVERGLVPPNLHFETPNPHVGFDRLPVRVPTTTETWPQSAAPRRAAVSAFGFSGSNAHVVLEQAPPAEDRLAGVSTQVLLLSAASPEALRQLALRHAAGLDAIGDREALERWCHTAALRRAHRSHRLAVVGREPAELAAALRGWAEGAPSAGVAEGRVAIGEPRLVGFVFSGQGTQWAGMASALADEDADFAADLETIEAALARAGRPGLRAALRAEDETLTRTAWAQPAIFAVQLALVRWLERHGVRPDAVLGHSVGELAAAHVAGALDLDAAARVVVARADRMDATTGQGRMLAVDRGAEAVRALLPELELAAVNGPRSVVLAGPEAALTAARAVLEADGATVTDLGVPYAFHSAVVDAAAASLVEALVGLVPAATAVPLYSTVTGARLDGAALDAGYWGRNVRAPVQLWSAASALVADGHRCLIELGPHAALTRHLAETGAEVTHSLRRARADRRALLELLARLHVTGVEVDWSAIYGGAIRPVRLPSYPWEHRALWGPGPAVLDAAMVAGITPLTGARRELAGQALAHYESRISAARPAFLADHAMHGVVLVPAAGFVEILRSAAGDALGAETVALEGLEIREPLVLSPDAQVEVQTQVHADGEVRVYSGRRGAWTLHARARASITSVTAPAPLATAGLGDVTPAAALYEAGARSGVGLGPAFRVLTTVRRGPDAAEARVEVSALPELEAYAVHPALLDACFQVAVAALDDARRGDGILLPTAVERAIVGRARGHRFVARFQLVEASARGFSGDAELWTEDGERVARLEGLRFVPAPEATLRRAARRQAEPLALGRGWAALAPAPGAEPRRFRLLGVAPDLAAALAEVGRVVEDDATDLVVVGELEAGLAAVRAPSTARVWLLAEPADAALCGLARTAALEQERAEVRSVELRHAEPAAVARLLAASPAARDLRVEGDAVLAARVERLSSPDARPFAASAERAHLVTGAFGALGRALVDWLVARGARRLVLVGRTAPGGEVARRLQALEAEGVALSIVVGDVASAEVVDRAVAAAGEGGLASVFHAAGVLEDRPLSAVDSEGLARVLSPKLEGARQLDARVGEVEHFVLFSSIAALVGSPGQAAYTAANAGLDALAEARRARGRPALSVQWGAFEIGMARGVDASRRGLGVLDPEAAFDALASWLAYGVRAPAVLALAHLDPAAFARAFGRRRPAALDAFAPAAASRAVADPLAALEGEARAARAASLVEAEIRAVLGLDAAEALDPGADLATLGMDSIMAIELRDRIEARFGREVPAAALFERPSRDGVVALLLESSLAEPASRIEIVADAAARHAPFPLSDVQEAYWIGRGGALELGGVSCHYYGEFEREGLDAERLVASWRRLVERHEMLRAVVDADGRQRILERLPEWTVPVVDLSDRSPEAVAEALEATRAELSHQMFDTARWPLFDVRLHLLPGGRTRLHFSFDLLIVDVFSFALLLAEWRRLYEGAALEPVSLSFRDYVIWEHGQQSTEAYQGSLEHWRRRLETLPPAPELRLARSPRSIRDPRFSRRQGQLDAARWSRLVQRARQAAVTPTMVVCAAYAHVLERWSRSPRFTLNLTLFNRPPVHPDVMRVVGDFTSLVLLEVDLSAADGFEARAQRLQRRLREDLPHRQVSGVRVLREWSRAQGRMARAPIVFTSALGLTRDAFEREDSADAWLGEVKHSVSQTPQVWLDHQVYEREGGLFFVWDAVDALFPDGMLDEMFEAFQAVLHRLSDDESAWTEPELDVLPTAQLAARRAVNATEGPRPSGLLHDALAVQAERRPEARAVVAPDASLSYAELYRAALRVAHALRGAGVRPGDHVGVALEKSVAQVVAVFGVLAAGGVYVPIDPALPPARRRLLAETTGATAVLVRPVPDARLGWPEAAALVAIDDEACPGEDDAPLPCPRQPSDPAYVIFTSGSTGQPKGVVIDHRGALNTCVDVNERFGVGPGDAVFGISSLSFDLSVYDVFGTVAAGACLVLPAADAARDPRHWLDCLQRHSVSVWSSVPALMGMLVEYVQGEAAALPESLRLVMLSGDWIPVDLPDTLRGLRPGVELISLGGATEASIWSILYPIGEVDPAWKSIPYGVPMRNQSFHVLDPRGLDRPSHVPGELFIGGVGVALGYHGDPEKTAARFVPHPRTGERLYATGDLGAYRPDGVIEFLGREDLQVKIQGHRIELGEIESALRSHPAVREAVVEPWGKAGGRQLVAYVLPELVPDRVPLSLPCSITAGDRVARARVVDVSEGGLGLRGLPEGLEGPVRVAFSRGEQRTELDGVLAWTSGEAGGFSTEAGGLAGLLASAEAPLRWRYARSRRGAVRVPVEASPNGVTLADLSRTGLGLSDCPEDWAPGAEVAFRTRLLGEPVAFEGVVAWRSGARAGIALSADLAARLEPMVHKLLAERTVDAAHTERLRVHLAERLPSYMVPRAFVLLDRLPLSSNGKVDRAALPAPELEARTVKPPSNALEAKILAVWKEVLGVEEVGVDDSFFEVGGFSQLAVRLVLKLQETIGRDIPIRALFDAPTVEGLARLLGGEMEAAPDELPDEALYAHYARRAIGERLTALGTDKHYHRAEGTRLWYREAGREIEVLDMVGGYGSTILGHNHPELVELMRRLLAEQTPSHTQYTNNVHVGRLCRALSRRLEAAVGEPFVVTLASTGTEASEAAIKHAKLEYRWRGGSELHAASTAAALVLDQVEKGRARLSDGLLAEASERLGPVDDLAAVLARMEAWNAGVLEREPVFLGLNHAFHGMSTGALSVTASADLREPFRWMGARARLVAQREGALEAAVEAERTVLYVLGFDAEGRVVLRARPWHTVAALFLEPIQGEGGIRPVDRGFASRARALADAVGFPIVVDEVQAGMGRSGHFTAAEGIGLAGDYYTFSKSLGGGLTKTAAMAVRERRYHPEFGYLHGSTFAEESVGAQVALRTLEILDRDGLIALAAEKGRVFTEKLRAMAARHPTVIREVRGSGLMLGVEIASQESSPSLVLRAVSQSDPEMFNQVLAGFLLYERGIRIAPTKTRSTIRFLPSVHVSEAEMDRVVEAFDHVCEVVEKLAVGRLLRFLVDPEVDPSAPIEDWRDRYPEFVDVEPEPGEPRVAHIAHIEDDGGLVLGEPSLAELPDALRPQLLSRLFRFTRPAVGQRIRVRTATGESVHLSLVGLVLTSGMFESMMRGPERQLLLDKIEDAIDAGVRAGAEVIGFGGYTSIVTANCTMVATTRASLTSGNAYTVVLAVQGALQEARAQGLDLSKATVGIVGANGNIGSIAARVIAAQVPSLVLVGRDAADPRLRSVANRIFCWAEDAILEGERGGLAGAILDTAPVRALREAGRPMGGGRLHEALDHEHGGTQPWVRLSGDLSDLADCDLIISCTNASVPVIHPEHLSERVRVICDVATPKDVHPSVRHAFPELVVLSGGLARLPNAPGVQLTGTRLPVDHVYGCVAETTLLGVARHRGHFSFGDIDASHVETIAALAERHGYSVGTVREDE